MASLTDLPGVAEQLLGQFVAELTKQHVELPERQYRTPGSLIPWDGEQLTVSLMGIDQGQPGIGLTTSMVPEALVLYASFTINLLRAVAVLNVEGYSVDGEVPTAEQLDESGVDLLSDAQQLILAASAIHRGYAVTGPGEGFVIGPLSPVGPEGGLAGSRLMISLSLS